MTLSRRLFLAGLSISATPLRAADGVPSAATLAQPVKARDAAGLEIKDEDGALVPVGDWRGRWVVLNLWAPWCQPCRREMPSLERLSAALPPHVALVPLAFEWRGPIWVRKFYREVGITGLPVYLGDGENMHETLGLSDLPTTAIINPEGHHVFTVAGEATWNDAATLEWLSGLPV